MKTGRRSKADHAICTAIRLGLLPMVLILILAESVRGQTLSFAFGGGSTTLTISTAAAGSEPNDASDNASGLTWDGQGILSKITTVTSAPGQSFSLFVTLDVTSGSGTSLGEVELTDSMLDSDLLTGIPIASPTGSGTLTYRARSAVSQGGSAEEGDDVHTITYTIVAQ